MKRFIKAVCFMLAAVLIAGVMPVGSLAVESIGSVEIVGYESPVSGQTAGSAVLPVLADDSQCEIVEYSWYCDSDNMAVTSEAVFIRTKMYSLNIVISAKGGCSFEDGVSATINGGTDLIDYGYCSIMEDGKKLSIWTVPENPLPSGEADYIHTVDVKNFFKPLIGSTPANTDLPTVSSYAAYTITEAYWYCETDGAALADNGKFESGKAYSLCMTFEPLEGFDFADDLTFTINGSTALVNLSLSGAESSESAFLRTVPIGALREYIKSVTVNGYVPPLIGKSVSDMPAFTVPDGANYSVGGYSWICETDGDVYLDSSDTFEEGKKYYVTVEIYAADECEFSSSPSLSFGGTIDSIDTMIGTTYICLVSAASGVYTDVVTSVNVTGYTKPLVGQTAAEIPSLSVPDGAHYAITNEAWYCDTTNRYMNEEDAFALGNQYSLYLKVWAEDGYCFTKETAYYVNGGTEYVDGFYSGVDSVTTLGIWTVSVYPDDNADPKIEKINILGTVDPIAGTTPDDVLGSLSVVGGSRYGIESAVWYDVTDPEEINEVGHSAKFVKGRRYSLSLYVKAESGFYFDENTKLLINGKTNLVDPESSYIDNDPSAGAGYVIRTVAITSEEYTPLTEVRVTGYRPPLIGQTAAENLSSLEFSDGVIPVDIGWIIDTDGRQMEDDETFESGKSYYIYFNFTAGSHYYFDEDLIPATCVNNSALLVDSDYTHFSDDLFVFFTVNVSPSEDNGKELITKVNLTGFVTPVAGMTFAELKAAISVEDGAPYTIYDMACFSYANESNMDDGDRYEAGKQYYFYFLILPDEGYEFNYDAGLPMSYINGERDLIDDYWSGIYTSEDGTTMFGLSTYDLTAEEAPAPDYGDCNGDGKVDGKDLIRLRKHLVGADVEIGPGADVNGDGTVNGKDLIRLRKYLLTEDASLLGPQ